MPSVGFRSCPLRKYNSQNSMSYMPQEAEYALQHSSLPFRDYQSERENVDGMYSLKDHFSNLRLSFRGPHT